MSKRRLKIPAELLAEDAARAPEISAEEAAKGLDLSALFDEPAPTAAGDSGEGEGPLSPEEHEHIAMQVHRNPNTARSFLVQRLPRGNSMSAILVVPIVMVGLAGLVLGGLHLYAMGYRAALVDCGVTPVTDTEGTAITDEPHDS